MYFHLELVKKLSFHPGKIQIPHTDSLLIYFSCFMTFHKNVGQRWYLQVGYSDFDEISAEYGFALITFQQLLIHSEQPCGKKKKKKGIQMTF